MLDGRIDTQGNVSELRAHGVLDDITHESEVEVHKEEQKAAAEESTKEEVADAGEDAAVVEEAKKKEKKPRKLVKDEEREEGSVKWRIYKTYLQASCVLCFVSMRRSSDRP
jgi:hypothetical protein